ncbi:MAG: hypothetical protein KKD73_08145 [Proteobacteria bacterium]|nr:hypothetical protein [Pseudomonadota bacterium]MBU1639452.1 hypothetical protein [Pseudomonadota bacterium]
MGMVVLCCVGGTALAAEDPDPQQATGAPGESGLEDLSVYYETEGAFSVGYRWLSSADSLKAAEYIYPHSSATFALDLLSCPLPYRYHINAEYLSSYDFYSDAGFAYKDLILFRDILVGVHHNLNHYTYQYSGEPPALTYTDRNAGEKYNTDFTSNLLSLRLKAPDFPFHTFLTHRHIEQDGMIQQRYLLGYFDPAYKVSQSRDIDWQSNAVKLGANSHAGPLELEYAYDNARFKPGPDNILYDSYPAAGDPVRPADIYPHNVVPETESSAHSVKLHSSHTGGLVTAATLSNLTQKNNYSHAESTTWKGALDCSWILDPAVGLFFKYRHKTIDMDTPDTVTLVGLNNTLNYTVRQGISSDQDVFSLSTRYRQSRMLSLFASYEFSHLERQDVEDWVVLPERSDIHTLNVTAHVKPMDKVNIKARYEYKNYDNPAYNISPDASNKLLLTTTYTPASWFSIYLQYILSLTERNSLRYLNSSPAIMLEEGERDGRHDQFLASLSTELSATLNLTASWYYQRWDVDQDLAYGKWQAGVGDLPYWDYGSSYTDECNSFSLALHYLPRPDITLVAGVTYTMIEGEYGYEDVVGGAPFALSSFSALKANETSLSLEIGKMLSREWEVGIKSYVDLYNDRAYDVLDGKVFTTILNVKRYF